MRVKLFEKLSRNTAETGLQSMHPGTFIRSKRTRRDGRCEDKVLSLQDGRGMLLAVFDGVSLPFGGEIAAEDARQGVEQAFNKITNIINVEKRLKDIFEAGARNIQTGNTTSTGAFIWENEGKLMLTTINAGDSKVLIFRGGKLYCMTIDHDLVNLSRVDASKEQILKWQKKEWENPNPQNKRMKNSLSRSMEDCLFDISTIETVPGDIIIVATDGLEKGQKPSEIENFLSWAKSNQKTDQAIAEALGQRAYTGQYQNETADDIGLAVVSIPE